MEHTTRLNLPFIHSGQAQKEITHNESLELLDILINPVVQAVDVNAPPEEAVIGQLYVIGQNPEPETAFEHHANKIAKKISQNQDPNNGVLGDGWRFILAPKWLEVTIDATGKRYRFDGANWLALPEQNEYLLQKDSGEYLKILHLQEEVALLDAHTDTIFQIPHHSIVIAVTLRVLEEITGTDSFSIGVEGAENRYGGNLNTAQNTTNLGLTDHPLTYWQDTQIRLTADNGEFTGGVVQITAQILKPHGAWNWE